jgi:hypothetical protein
MNKGSNSECSQPFFPMPNRSKTGHESETKEDAGQSRILPKRRRGHVSDAGKE